MDVTNEIKEQRTCEERVTEHLNNTLEDLRKLWDLYCEDSEAYDEDLGNFEEYGLSFDYVAPETFDDQREGYFRYQLSYGGPADEFRFYTNPDFSLYNIEYWFLDWFDGAKKEIYREKDWDLLESIFEFFRDCGTVESEYLKGIEE